MVLFSFSSILLWIISYTGHKLTYFDSSLFCVLTNIHFLQLTFLLSFVEMHSTYYGIGFECMCCTISFQLVRKNTKMCKYHLGENQILFVKKVGWLPFIYFFLLCNISFMSKLMIYL